MESAHHWIKLFREKTAHVTGFQKKFVNFADLWMQNQSTSGQAELDEVLQKGAKLKYAPRKRTKADITDLLVPF